jgi:hypothetical protein
VALHGPVADGQEDRLRPSDEAISALVATWLADWTSPAPFWNVAAVWTPPGQRVHCVELDFRPRRPRLRCLAELLRHIRRRTVVDRKRAGIHAAHQHDALSDARVDEKIKPLAHAAVIGRVYHEIADLPELFAPDIVEAAHRIAAPAGQPGIGGAVMQYGSKSPGVTARLSVARTFPYHVRK